ncbi:MAG TPA: Hsp20/alpha crystallin family protein, partial [Vicinamibacteria bacterium]|nr:Hsp20/alpha crystallin family protein [Vicinamibacteria bacterium]
EPGELGAWAPRIDVYEKGDNIIIDAEIPGLKKEDIEVTVENQMLTLRGEKKETKEVKRDGFYQSERFYGKFQRAVALPAAVDESKIEATYKDGILTVTMPKSEEARAKHIAIK